MASIRIAPALSQGDCNKSLLLEIALWTEPYTNARLAPNEW